jgi:hypothetical protein
MKLNVQIQRINLTRFIILLCLAFSVTGYLRAETHMLGSISMNVTSGTSVTDLSNLLLDNGGVLDNQGTLTVKGNLTNSNTSASNLGTGTYIFAGTSPQTISGPNIFNHVTINNTTGVSLTGSSDNTINGIFTLTSGRFTLGNLNLLLGTTATIGGTPAAGNMVVPTGTGELRKSFAGTGSFTYPVGDNDGTAEYSPVTTNFTTGTFPGGNYLGVNLKNLPDPDPTVSTGDYLNRYWVLDNSNISGYSCNLTFTFTDADVVGTKANLFCVESFPIHQVYDPYVSNNHLTGTVTSFGRFTGANGAMALSLTAILQGPFDGTSTMSTALRTAGLVPLAQPYNTAPWNYPGTESVGSIPVGVVDWVLVELRQATAPALASSSTVLARRAGFIKSNGTITETDGTATLKFNVQPTTGYNLYAVIYHRNHIGIMSNNAVPQISGVFTYDFSTAQTQIYNGSGTGCILVGSKWCLVAGDADGSGVINNDDLLIWQTNFAASNYNPADFNLTGVVNNDDLIIWQNNFAQQTKIPN